MKKMVEFSIAMLVYQRVPRQPLMMRESDKKQVAGRYLDLLDM